MRRDLVSGEMSSLFSCAKRRWLPAVSLMQALIPVRSALPHDLVTARLLGLLVLLYWSLGAHIVLSPRISSYFFFNLEMSLLQF